MLFFGVTLLAVVLDDPGGVAEVPADEAPVGGVTIQAWYLLFAREALPRLREVARACVDRE